jgi:hypothetical protein
MDLTKHQRRPRHRDKDWEALKNLWDRRDF